MNIQNLVLDINKKCNQIVTANVGEVGSRFLKINIIDNGMPVDLTGVTVYLYAKKADDTKVFNTVKVEDAKQGIVLVEITSQVLAIEGLIKLTLLLVKDNARLATKIFNLKVDETIIDDEAIESANEFGALTESLSKLGEWNSYFEETSGKIEEKYTERLNQVDSQLEHITNTVIVNELNQEIINLIKNKNLNIEIQEPILLEENLDINVGNIFFTKNGSISVKNGCKVVIKSKVVNYSNNKQIFIDNNDVDIDILNTLKEDEKGIYIQGQQIYLDWFYDENNLGNSWFNKASRSACNYSYLIGTRGKTYNIKGQIYLPMFFNGENCTLKFYGSSSNYANILVYLDHTSRPRHTIQNFIVDASELESIVEYGMQIGGTQYSTIENITIIGTKGSPEVQKLRYGMLIKPLNVNSADIDHPRLRRLRLSNCGILISTNSEINRGNITEMYFEDCSFGNNGTKNEPPIQMINSDSSKTIFSVHFRDIFISQYTSGKCIYMQGCTNCSFDNITQEYYRGDRLTSSEAGYSLELDNCKQIRFANCRFGDLSANNFIKMNSVNSSVFDNFDIYVPIKKVDVDYWGDMVMLNIENCYNNIFRNTKDLPVRKVGTDTWGIIENGDFYDRMNYSKIVGDVSGNTFYNFMGISSKTPSFIKSDLFENITYGTKVSISDGKIIFNRNGIGNPTTENYFKINTNTKVSTIVAKIKMTDTEKTPILYIGNANDRKAPMKKVQSANDDEGVWVRTAIYSDTKEVYFYLYDVGGASILTVEFEEFYVFDGLGGDII